MAIIINKYLKESGFMNKIVLLGRLTKDPELKEAESSKTSYIKFNMAVERRFKTEEAYGDVDFIPIIAWSKNAEVISKYLKKGDLISISGRLSINSFKDEEGKNKQSTNVILEEFTFVPNNNAIKHNKIS